MWPKPAPSHVWSTSPFHPPSLKTFPLHLRSTLLPLLHHPALLLSMPAADPWVIGLAGQCTPPCWCGLSLGVTTCLWHPWQVQWPPSYWICRFGLHFKNPIQKLLLWGENKCHQTMPLCWNIFWAFLCLVLVYAWHWLKAEKVPTMIKNSGYLVCLLHKVWVKFPLYLRQDAVHPVYSPFSIPLPATHEPVTCHSYHKHCVVWCSQWLVQHTHGAWWDH